MRNRRPTPGYEGRVLITPENPEIAPFFARVAMADNPIDEGTPMTAETFLKTVTAGMLGLDPQVAVPDDAFKVLAALAASGGGGSGDVGDLEDTALEVGTIVNAGAGWNTYHFREAFDAPPQVVLQPEDFDGVVLIKDITAEGFLYCLRMLSTGSYYTAAGTASSSAHSANTLVSGTTTTADEVKIHYMAVEYGGER